MPQLGHRFAFVLQAFKDCEWHIFGDNPAQRDDSLVALESWGPDLRVNVRIEWSGHFCHSTVFAAVFMAINPVRACSPERLGSDHIPVSDREQKNQFLICFLLFPSGLQDFICAIRGGPHSVCYRSSQVKYVRGLHNEDF